ncbi:MAG: LrgB family protein [Bacteroidaceae bacterium]|nr:LrgB family protein [Prevotellaceae bacterium]MDD7659040.1 LrgB family protein [Prevotellaceae bacterium]MDY5598304.1 LrgB family protein [Bacteroidaceae bacterium]MEE1240972.1 LrgB family protein [Bacteroidaceae bacterium]
MSTHEYLSNDYFLLTLTFGVYFLAKLVRKLLRLPLFNPILVSIAFLIIFLRVADVDYEEYRVSGAKIDFWLKPAVVALGVPLYKQLSSIRQEILPILLSQLAGCVVGVVSVVGIARLMGASTDVVLSLAAKSVTTPIAMEVTESVGGIPALTATIVVFVGIFGAITGFRILRYGHIGMPSSQGISLGTASHAVGTSAAMERSMEHGAYASLGLTLNGIFTAILAPYVLHWMGVM